MIIVNDGKVQPVCGFILDKVSLKCFFMAFLWT